MKRTLARIALIVIAVLLILLLILALSGAPREYLLADLFVLMIVPAVIYVYMWFTDLTKGKKK